MSAISLEVKESPIHGHGLFARKPVKGNVVLPLAEVSDKYGDVYGGINSSQDTGREPNVYTKFSRKGNPYFVTARPIRKGEELLAPPYLGEVSPKHERKGEEARFKRIERVGFGAQLARAERMARLQP